MHTIRTFSILAIAPFIAACPAKVNFAVKNVSEQGIEVHYGATPVTLMVGESTRFSAFLGSQIFRIKTVSGCIEYETRFADLAGGFYKPGVVHTLFLVIDRNLNVIIVPHYREQLENVVIKGKDSVCAA